MYISVIVRMKRLDETEMRIPVDELSRLDNGLNGPQMNLVNLQQVHVADRFVLLALGGVHF